MAELEPVVIGGRVAAYRPADSPKSTAKKAAQKKAAASTAKKAEEATE